MIYGKFACGNDEVFVFEFGNEAKPIPVFNDYAYIFICNNYPSLDNESMLLTINTDMKQAYFSSNEDALEIFTEVDLTDSGVYTEHVLISKVDGQKFVKA